MLEADNFIGACCREAMTPKTPWTLLFFSRRNGQNPLSWALQARWPNLRLETFAGHFRPGAPLHSFGWLHGSQAQRVDWLLS